MQKAVLTGTRIVVRPHAKPKNCPSTSISMVDLQNYRNNAISGTLCVCGAANFLGV